MFFEPRELQPEVRLDQRIQIEYQPTTQDATYGTQLGAWTILDTVWGNVREELVSDGDTGAVVRLSKRAATLRIRYREDVNTTMRVTLLDRSNNVMRIVGGPREIPRKRFVEFALVDFSTTGDGA